MMRFRIPLLFWACLTASLMVFSQPSPIMEQVQLHTDRELYLAGERVWFQGQLVENQAAGYYALSRVLLLELADQGSKVWLQQKVGIVDRRLSGALALPEDLPSGGYVLRAYTTYQRNGPVEGFLMLPLRILNPRQSLPTEAVVEEPGTENPYPALESGPAPGGQALRLAPLHVAKPPVNWPLRVEMLSAALHPLGFLPTSIQAADSAYLIPDHLLPPGLSYLRLVDQAQQVVATAALWQADAPEIDLLLSEGTFSRGDSCSVQVRAPGAALAQGTLSVVALGTTSPRDSLPAYLHQEVRLLPGWLGNQGPLNAAQTAEVRRLLPRLADAQGAGIAAARAWSTQEKLSWLPDLRGPSVHGRVLREADHQPQAEVNGYLSIPGPHPQLYPFRTDEEGNFQLSLPHLTGAQKLVVGLDTEEALLLQIRQDFAPDWPALRPWSLGVDASQTALIEALYLEQQLISAYPELQVQRLPPAFPPIPGNLSPPLKSVTLSDFIEFPNLTEVINEVGPNLQIRQIKGRPHLTVFDESVGMLYEDPLILVDDMAFFSVESLLDIPPGTVARIEVTPRRYVLGDQLLTGIVHFRTKRGRGEGLSWPGPVAFFSYQGLAPETYSPKPIPTVTTPLPDFRSTLSWQTGLTAGPEPTAVSFRLSQQPGPYEVRFMGYRRNGQVVGAYRRLEVE
ncbi:MAG: hypothetical protein D6722_18335 [Bacteroidetes bacterium]|nr:MAG: hypothetical protein D6722_18335 [Bacteroidota bacterium]